jgi:hypothetical protein
MKRLIKEITAYRYSELGKSAQKMARKNFLAEEHLAIFFSEDLENALNEQYGLFNLKTYYSLSYSQGDGLCLAGGITYSEIFENSKFKQTAFKGIHDRQIQTVKDELYGFDFEHCNRYCYAGATSIKSRVYKPSEKQEELIEKITRNVKEWYYSFCLKWEQLGYEYFHEMSGKEMEDICATNDCLFTKEGELIDMDGYKELKIENHI